MLFGRWTRIPSSYNGRIDVHTAGERLEIFVDGYDQSTAYIRKMWQAALNRLPDNAKIEKVLVLGLGGGTVLGEIAQRFPACSLTAVEHDPAMIAIFREHWPGDTPVEIIEGDALAAIQTITATFDFLVVDLFTGQTTAPFLEDSATIERLAARLVPDGLCLLNAFKNEKLFPLFAEVMTPLNKWRYKYNALGLYRKQ